MGALAPWGLEPAGPGGLDRFTAYWYATVCAGAYQPESVPRAQLYDLVGAGAPIRVQTGNPSFPSLDVSFTTTGRAIAVARGTATTVEMLLHPVGLPLISAAPWPGQVGFIWRAGAVAAWAQLGPLFTSHSVLHVAWAGHSYGGALATLLPELALDAGLGLTDCVFSIGSPRVGNLAFSQAWTYRYLRVTNHLDPVAMVPPSANSLLDRALWILAPAPLGSYWHVGTRAHLFITGAVAFPPEQSTWATAEDTLIAGAVASTDWFRAHATEEYARRLRIGIAAPWSVPSTEFPGIDVIDTWWNDRNLDPPASTWSTAVYCPGP